MPVCWILAIVLPRAGVLSHKRGEYQGHGGLSQNDFVVEEGL
jgi:hypothetical protein